MAGRMLAISIHDVAPATWPACEVLLDLVESVGVAPVTLLVVPDYHGLGRVDRDPGFRRAIDRRLDAGDEVALHGYRHVDDAPLGRGLRERLVRRVYTAAEGEFAALDRRESQRRIAAGLAVFDCCGWPVDGFTPPAWLLGDDAAAALAAAPFGYVALRDRLVRKRGPAILGPSLVLSPRSAWRRALSRQFVRLVSRRSAALPLVRPALHPADARHPALMATWRHALEQLRADRRSVTEGTAVSLMSLSAVLA